MAVYPFHATHSFSLYLGILLSLSLYVFFLFLTLALCIFSLAFGDSLHHHHHMPLSPSLPASKPLTQAAIFTSHFHHLHRLQQLPPLFLRKLSCHGSGLSLLPWLLLLLPWLSCCCLTNSCHHRGRRSCQQRASLPPPEVNVSFPLHYFRLLPFLEETHRQRFRHTSVLQLILNGSSSPA